jgi:FkbM family methyltransferase
MKSYNPYEYFGWTVSADDPMFPKLYNNNYNILEETQKDIKKFESIVEKYLPNKRVALDIGCLYGFFTKYLASKFEHVHAFDFDNDIFFFFKENMKKFNIENLTAHSHGLGEENIMVAINDIIKKKHILNNVVVGINSFRGTLSNHINTVDPNKTQQIKTLDSLNINDVDLIMIDTEGYELPVIKGGIETIKKYKPIIIAEFHYKNLTSRYRYKKEETLELLYSLEYKFLEQLNTVDKVFVHSSKTL